MIYTTQCHNFFFFNDTATTEIYTLSLHDALPILPGDTLLFAVGTFAALGALDLAVSLIMLSVAAVAGDSTNYAIGYRVGPSVFRGERSRWLNREYLDRTHQFYERHGSKTIVIARFVPIVRTFAPFVAGIGRMTYSRF